MEAVHRCVAVAVQRKIRLTSEGTVEHGKRRFRRPRIANVKLDLELASQEIQALSNELHAMLNTIDKLTGDKK